MLVSYLISVAIKSSILLAAGLVCLRFMRRDDAATRHLICLTALASAAAVPLLALWSPHWSFLLSVPAGPGVGSAKVHIGTASWHWPMFLAAAWLFGALVMLARGLSGWALLLRVRRRSVHFRDEDGAQVRIATVTTPLTCGALRPMILLPAAARDWDDARLRAVLLHESAHIRRRDCAAKYVGQASRALLWCNPLAWIIAARMNHEQELACDAAVLSAGIPADAYASVILDVARECSSSLVLGCAMGANKSASALRERFDHLFQWRREVIRPTRRAAIAISLLLGPLLLGLTSGVSFAEKIYRIGPGIVAPVVLEKSEPQYTNEAKDAKIEGPVTLTIVVGTDERAHDIRVTRSLDPGLDASAIASLSTWRFQPATKNGEPVPVKATVVVNFRLQ